MARLLRYCYCLDFQDEQDCEQLSDLFKSLLESDRVQFSYEKQINPHRAKVLPILTKALTHALFTDFKAKANTRMVYGSTKNPLGHIRW